jgi:acyl carrier protein
MDHRIVDEHVWTQICEAATELLQERGEDVGPLSDDTRLGRDLGISSVEVIHMLVMIEDRVASPLSFQELAVRDGEYVDDLSLGELRRFVTRSVAAARLSSASGT